MSSKRFSGLLMLPLVAAGLVPASARAAADKVIVLGALHSLHSREKAFGYDELGATILAFAPDVLVLEVRPEELADRKPTPGRPEYPAVIWPLLAKMKVSAVAMEPGGRIFDEITGEAGAAFGAFKQRDPTGAAALSRLDAAAEDVLLSYWQRPGQVQDEKTARLAVGLQAAQFALAGPAFAAAQARWDGYMAARVLQAVRANPGKRIMVIASYKNRAALEQAVHQAAPQRALNASAWFDGKNTDGRVDGTPLDRKRAEQALPR